MNTKKIKSRGDKAVSWAKTVVFRDDLGLLLFLGGVFLSFLVWQINVKMNDNYVFANALVGVLDGHLYMDELVYGETLNYPGRFVADGEVYGRNYAELFLAVPFVWVLQLFDYIVDLKILLSAIWSLLLLGITRQISFFVEKRDFVLVAGSLISLGLFVFNVLFAVNLKSKWIPYMGLQLSTMVAAGLVGVILYRLITDIHGRKLGFVAGFGIALASPLTTWSVMPKRHVLAALLSLLTIYFFYRARTESERDTELFYRTLSYATVGIYAWLHAPEALVLAAVLVVLDLATSRHNDSKSLTVVFGGFLISLIPFLMTNYYITGSFLKPPRVAYSGEGSIVGKTGSGGKGGGASPPGSGFPPVRFVLSVFDRIGIFTDLILKGIVTTVERPLKYFDVFFRSGRVESVDYAKQNQAVRGISVMESMPVIGTLFALIPLTAKKVKNGAGFDLSGLSDKPVVQTDIFVLVYSVIFTLMYIPRLPIQSSLTMRYLIPIYPLLMYAVFRLPAIRYIFKGEESSFPASYTFWTFFVTVFIVGQMFIANFSVLNPRVSEAIQFHAIISLASGVLLGVWSIAATLGYLKERWMGQILVGLTFGFGALFTILYKFVYSSSPGWMALPIVRVISGMLTGIVS